MKRPQPVTRAAWGRAILLATLLAYPVLGTLVVVTPLPTLVASMPARLLATGAAIALLLSRAARPVSPARLMLFLFWAIYLVRLVWDTAVARVEGADEALFFFTVTCFLPALAILRSRPEWFKERELAKPLFILGTVAGGTALLIGVTGLARDRSLWEVTGRLAFDAVNPITYGHAAVTALLAAICLWLYRPSPIGRGWLLAGSLLSLLVLQQTGSRGPALALVIGLLLIGIYRRRARPLVALFIAVGAAILALTGGGALEERVGGVEDDPSTLERLLVQANAIEQFLSNPLTGNAYIETGLMIYPHNPFIEAAMATGLPGLLTFTAAFVMALLGIWRMLRGGRLLLPLIAVQYLVGAMLSGALYLSTPFWLAIALVFVFDRPAKRRPRPRRPAATAPAGDAPLNPIVHTA